MKKLLISVSLTGGLLLSAYGIVKLSQYLEKLEHEDSEEDIRESDM